MVSSGTTAVATASASLTDVIAAASMKGNERSFAIVNEGGAAGFYSVDNGVTLCRLPANSTVVRDKVGAVSSVKVQRDGGTNLTGIYAEAWGG